METTPVLASSELLNEAREFMPDLEDSALVEQALRTFIHVQAGRAIMKLGGSAPDMPDIPRRRWS